MKFKSVIYSALFLCLHSMCLFSQAPRGDFSTFEVLDNLDTVQIHRQLSSWWFGASGGVTLGMSFSDLKIPDIIVDNNDDVIPTNMIDFNTGYGSGYFFGLYGEFLPVDEMWGVALRINFTDFRKTESESDPMQDNYAIDSTCKYINTNKLNYITIAPSARYNLPITNLYVLVGADLEFNVSKEILKRKEFRNSANISHDKILTMKPNGFRAAFHVGVGYDIFTADINNAVRAYISPFASIHIGTNEISEYESSRMPFLLKLGANVKFNIDKKRYDTIPFDINYVEPPQYLATFRKETGVNFPGFIEREYELAGNLREVPVEDKVVAVLKEIEPEVEVVATTKVQPKQEEPKKKNITINPAATKIFYYGTSESSTLSKIDKEYLDALSEYLEKNPRVTVRISGHSDNAGSTVQNLQRSENRARVVVNYLCKNGIARRRILDRGRGALDPIADNATAAGRKKNRRLEIQIVR